MADKTGQNTHDIRERLLAGGHAFDFAQVMRLARMLLDPDGKVGLPNVPWRERAHVRADLSFTFPASDVKRIERAGDDGSDLLITAAFLGLYGTSTPLPAFFSETLFEESAADESACRDFLDIIQQRTFHLYFQGWQKYRLAVRVVEERDPTERERLCCLIGLGEKTLAGSLPDTSFLLRYTSLLTHSKRSGHALETILRCALKMNCVHVVEDLKQWASIPADQQMRLGAANCTLDADAVMGTRMRDLRGRFRISMGPLSWEQYNSMLPGTPLYGMVARLVDFFVADPLMRDLELVLAAGEARPFVMDSPQFRLGCNIFVFSDQMPETSVPFPLSGEPPERGGPRSEPEPARFAGEEDLPRTLVHYFRDETAILRKLVSRYVEAHPNLAPMVTGSMADSGVERLVEGTAFANALLRVKLEDGMPEIIDELSRSLNSCLDKPVPATAIVAFTPGETIHNSQLIPAGAEIAAVPVDGTSCRFRTCHAVEVHPLVLHDALFAQPSGKRPMITLRMELGNSTLSAWRPGSLRFFLGKDYKRASELSLLLVHHLECIVIASVEGGTETVLQASCLRPVGLADSETLLPSTPDTSISRQILHEYFLFPDKHLFVELGGLEDWRDRGSGSRFDIIFQLSELPFGAPKIDKESFVLHATPVINLFRHESAPVPFTADGEPHMVRPAGKKSGHFQIYGLDRVTRLSLKNSEKQICELSGSYKSGSALESSWHVACEKSLVGEGYSAFISLDEHEDEASSNREKLLIDMTCTNGELPEKLAVGEIRLRAGATPEAVEFRNITPVTPALFPSSGINRPWRFLAGLSLNYLATSTVENFRSILRLYSAPDNRNQALAKANEKRIDGIVGIDVQKTGRVIRGRMIPGYDIRLKLSGDHYSGPGDLYLFSTVLERFFGGYVTGNCFTRLMVEDVTSGRKYEWPPRMGDRCVV